MDEPTIIIDPPVGPFSAPQEIEEWIETLRQLGEDSHITPSERSALDRALDQAMLFLELRHEVGGKLQDSNPLRGTGESEGMGTPA